ncbi:unnamed protein product [Orchesella dallaii]|uniref:Proteasome maturation protein n=1 Tax=Orchesella dallaii TaxID=48710 RepID=A0ABP1PP91_9HEXA
MSSKQFELPADALIHGLAAKYKGAQLLTPHPLEQTEKTHWNRLEQHDMAMLRKIQGLHAPLKLQMERKSVMKVGHLPFLPRHNVAHDALTGRDELIGFEDYLGHPRDPEIMGQPHAMVEKQLGML